MANKTSAGLLLYRRRHVLEIFLVHPGGPLWAMKDLGAWSIPKGEFVQGEDPLDAARREFKEETGMEVLGEFLPLAPVRQPSAKVIYAWAIEADLDPSELQSNVFSMVWPPRSGRTQQFPEVDRGAWFDLLEARKKIHVGQQALIDQLATLLGVSA